ncbi:hypothetical protein ANCCAN_10253 [Ancylostoma caninum]|uniref:Ras family protein n=1 Tax=Ancylostoma caninum TaxID=29170 RepID=A0A368GHC3_ANCCA|nr:hypothetical protein ANCCAN_10253 [Ancylostoma caninum]
MNVQVVQPPLHFSPRSGPTHVHSPEASFVTVQRRPPQIVLVGNKVDEERLRKVQVDAHCAFAKQHDLKAFYVSAKTGDSVTMMFR